MSSIQRTQDQEAVVDVLTEAFMDDPVACWLFPDPVERRRLQPRFYRHQLGQPLAEAYLTEDGAGASIWHTMPAAHQDEPLDPAFGASAGRLRALDLALGPRHPGEPHLYLFAIGVLGRRRGAGLGSAMLRDRLERADAEQLTSYLEASSAAGRALYRRHGFEDLGEPVRPADGPILWPMVRTPQH